MSELFYRNACYSTNDEITEVLLYPQSNFVGLYTFNQIKGRGQYGNSWASVAEQNLAYTLAIKTSCINHSDFLFNYYTAIAVQNYLANMTEKIVKIKWPNDIIVKNKKVVGILIEKKKINQENYFVIGIGINILQENFDKISNAGSLLTQTGKRFNLKQFTENLHSFLIEKFTHTPSDDEILAEFNSNLFKKDEISVFELDKTRQNGIIKNADKNGEIWIELEESGLKSFYHKEIKLLY
ncbi:biotin--[acetyl-CoA-carboxylase] ligase [Chryseobacterium balustinum]|uniref:Bifunctional protein BirA n=1 Tax=Chryseobacterium balustinum TaxID=246 RepID=A0AAX2IHX9_9FLAO|nr:biotin--[acetyl-CoA-carboxylase] ligase [Chryseobacterium balustinum]AZB31140.1 biotin--[acetyl-CoA-carboxylase] ligase [Chryseobacterium balustinum]SKB39691.1 BirA family transcriptional regulator, biotin operon repressor / biotin-[acetyl-CoA-carboxylase] ligase [Chryseobacterium balustinum]SQA87863.1 Bifunctional protein BirA [Chryseobacterium balustinum]